ncbi:MAG: pilus assembly protein [Kiritimatiellaeota bacterium]|nr:pilus assembly protein [Kiritimatiellota bacterium]
MIESVLVLMLMTVIFLGVFQFFYAAAARDVLDHAAARAARARAVGFNRWMTIKAARVAAIPVSGRMTMPEPPVDTGIDRLFASGTPGRAWRRALRARPGSAQAQLENALIPDYMVSPHSNQARQTLDYEAWEGGAHPLGIEWDEPNSIGAGAGLIKYKVWRAFDLLIPWADVARGFPTRTDPGTLTLEGRYEIERHYDYYLEGNEN